MSYDPLAVANQFIALAHLEGKRIDALALNKLCYFAHGYSLALYGESLLQGGITAREHGALVMDVFTEFGKFGSKEVEEFAMRTQREAFGTKKRIPYMLPENADNARNIIQKTWTTYKDYNGFEMSKISHVLGNPWLTYKESGVIHWNGRKIPDTYIKDYFKSLYNKKQEITAEEETESCSI